MARSIALVLMLSFPSLLGCASMRGFRPVSADCRARINHCMGQCAPETSPASNSAYNGPSNGFDSRTACERNCDAICN
jgi:hypothetical protein